jgi:hypothetical protein
VAWRAGGLASGELIPQKPRPSRAEVQRVHRRKQRHGRPVHLPERPGRGRLLPILPAALVPLPREHPRGEDGRPSTSRSARAEDDSPSSSLRPLPHSPVSTRVARTWRRRGSLAGTWKPVASAATIVAADAVRRCCSQHTRRRPLMSRRRRKGREGLGCGFVWSPASGTELRSSKLVDQRPLVRERSLFRSS